MLNFTDRILLESSLSRVWSHIEEYDIAIITAFKTSLVLCTGDNKQLTMGENKERNHLLKAKLLHMNYGVTSIDGNWIENYGKTDAKESKEDSFFIVNINDENFFNNITALGEEFCQDSVILKIKGKDAVLRGTNKAENPGLGIDKILGSWKGGKTAAMLSRINNRPFVFEHFGFLENIGKGYISRLINKDV